LPREEFYDFFASHTFANFENFLSRKYPEEYETFTAPQKLEHLENILMMGLRKSEEFLKMKQSCELLFNDHTPRADMIRKLGHIIYDLQKIEGFPSVRPLKLREIITRVIGSDKRFIDKYQKWILQYTQNQARFSWIDLNPLLRVFPSNQITAKEDWF